VQRLQSLKLITLVGVGWRGGKGGGGGGGGGRGVRGGGGEFWSLVASGPVSLVFARCSSDGGGKKQGLKRTSNNLMGESVNTR